MEDIHLETLTLNQLSLNDQRTITSYSQNMKTILKTVKSRNHVPRLTAETLPVSIAIVVINVETQTTPVFVLLLAVVILPTQIMKAYVLFVSSNYMHYFKRGHVW